MNWIAFFLGLLVGAFVTGCAFGYILRRYYTMHRRFPYRWVCPREGCHYAYESTSPTGTLEDADRHNAERHSEGI